MLVHYEIFRLLYLVSLFWYIEQNQYNGSGTAYNLNTVAQNML